MAEHIYPQDSLYFYDTPVGTLWIKHQPQHPSRYWLGIDSMPLGSFPSPGAAADDVCSHMTGWNAWDMRSSRDDDPQDLSDWHRPPPYGFDG
jgi:hypothetical protein